MKIQKFIVDGDLIEARVREGDSLLDTAVRARLPLHHSCGGMGTCGTCRVVIKEGLAILGPPDEVEAEIVRDRGFAPQERLACQISSMPGLLVELPAVDEES
jgi:2Fe-2S ferredoxin